jgi:hypothetical protein
MRASCRSAFGNLYVSVEPTALLYKEVPELPRQSWRQQPAATPERFRFRLGETTATLAAAEWADGVCS